MKDKASSAATHRTSQLQILLVENGADSAEAMAVFLQRYGYEVRVCADVSRAVQTVEAEIPDIILLDLGLSGTDGYEVAKKLRAKKTTKRPLMIALTDAKREECLRFYQNGIDLHMTKPVSGEEVAGFLKHYEEVTHHTANALSGVPKN